MTFAEFAKMSNLALPKKFSITFGPSPEPPQIWDYLISALIGFVTAVVISLVVQRYLHG